MVWLDRVLISIAGVCYKFFFPVVGHFTYLHTIALKLFSYLPQKVFRHVIVQEVDHAHAHGRCLLVIPGTGQQNVFLVLSCTFGIKQVPALQVDVARFVVLYIPYHCYLMVYSNLPLTTPPVADVSPDT